MTVKNKTLLPTPVVNGKDY